MGAVSLISESGLYKLIMRAQRSNPMAAEFQDWVTRTVLPAIRKDGMYVAGEEKVATGELEEAEFVLRAMTMLQANVERLSADNQMVHEKLNLVTLDAYRAACAIVSVFD